MPVSLRAELRLGREFLQEAVQHGRIEDGDRRSLPCSTCWEAVGQVNPQRFQRHGLTLEEVYKTFP